MPVHKNAKPLLLVGNGVSQSCVDDLCARGDFELLPATFGTFNSDEPFVELMRGQEKRHAANIDALQGRKVYVLQSTAAPVSRNVQHLLQAVHTLKHYGAAEVTAIMPFAAFMRQDRAFKERFTSIAADLFARQLKAAGADGVITFAPHSKGAIALYQNVFGANFTALHVTDLFAQDIKTRFSAQASSLCIGAPDGADKPQDEGQARARDLAAAVFGKTDAAALAARMFRISKTHTGVSDTKVTGFDGHVTGKHCVIVDDMIDGGGTMINAANLLKAQGALSVTCYAAHGILSGGALERLTAAMHDGMHPSIDKLVLADTVPDTADKRQALMEKSPSAGARVLVLSTGTALLNALTPSLQTQATPPAPHSRKKGLAP